MRARRDTKHLVTEYKSPGYWYLYCLFGDPEFTQQVDAIRSRLLSKYPAGAGFDVELLELVKADVEDTQSLYALADEYDISMEVLRDFGEGKYDRGQPINPIAAGAHSERGMIVMQFDPNMTEDQYRSYWSVFERVREQDLGIRHDRRVRGAENPQLVYSVRRARKKGLTFPEIYNLYKEGNLPAYSGSSTQHETSKSLENYYHRNK